MPWDLSQLNSLFKWIKIWESGVRKVANTFRWPGFHVWVRWPGDTTSKGRTKIISLYVAEIPIDCFKTLRYGKICETIFIWVILMDSNMAEPNKFWFYFAFEKLPDYLLSGPINLKSCPKSQSIHQRGKIWHTNWINMVD